MKLKILPPKMSVSELRELKEEEKYLLEIASKFNDQLNRLKVEELALMNQLRMMKEDESQATDVGDSVDEDNSMSAEDIDSAALLEELDLTVKAESVNAEYEEEEESEDEFQDDLKALMKQINAHNSHFD